MASSTGSIENRQLQLRDVVYLVAAAAAIAAAVIPIASRLVALESKTSELAAKIDRAVAILDRIAPPTIGGSSKDTAGALPR